MAPELAPSPDGLQDTLVTSAPASAAPPWWLRLVRPRTGRELVLLATRFPVGLTWFIILTVGFSLGAGLAIVIIGFAILAALAMAIRLGASIERSLIGFVDDRRIETPYRSAGTGALGALKTWITDPATYRDTLYLLLQFPLGIVSLVVLVIGVLVPVSFILSPLVYRFVDGGIPVVETDGGGIWIDTWWEAAIASAVGIGLLLVSAFVISAMATIHLWVGRGLLGPTASTRLATADQQRQQGVSASLSERRRIERDLHDGAQQQLVSVAMNLGRAQSKFDDDPEKARELLDAAQRQTKEAIAELRNLARGILPSVLTDRGLDPALSALALQSPFPVQVTTDVERRLPESVESTAYFVVAEALTNAAKHAGASDIRVNVRDAGEVLHVEVADNGRGGADPAGRGLRGLADRVASVGGRLSVTDGVQGGTVVRAELPCGS
ncbi:MAG: sensor histidine kinase [Actinomycetota bacterium]